MLGPLLSCSDRGDSRMPGPLFSRPDRGESGSPGPLFRFSYRIMGWNENVTQLNSDSEFPDNSKGTWMQAHVPLSSKLHGNSGCYSVKLTMRFNLALVGALSFLFVKTREEEWLTGEHCLCQPDAWSTWSIPQTLLYSRSSGELGRSHAEATPKVKISTGRIKASVLFF